MKYAYPTAVTVGVAYSIAVMGRPLLGMTLLESNLPPSPTQNT
jgi:hypothetical protein